jgi:hypothetical protein
MRHSLMGDAVHDIAASKPPANQAPAHPAPSTTSSGGHASAESGSPWRPLGTTSRRSVRARSPTRKRSSATRRARSAAGACGISRRARPTRAAHNRAGGACHACWPPPGERGKRAGQVLAFGAGVDDSDPVAFGPGLQVLRDRGEIGGGYVLRADGCRVWPAIRQHPGPLAAQGRRVLAQQLGIAPHPAVAGPGHRQEVVSVRGGLGIALEARLPVLPVFGRARTQPVGGFAVHEQPGIRAVVGGAGPDRELLLLLGDDVSGRLVLGLVAPRRSGPCRGHLVQAGRRVGQHLGAVLADEPVQFSPGARQVKGTAAPCTGGGLALFAAAG